MKQKTIKFGGLSWTPLAQTLGDLEKTRHAVNTIGLDEELLERVAMGSEKVQNLARKFLEVGTLEALISGTFEIKPGLDLKKVVSEFTIEEGHEAIANTLPLFFGRYLLSLGVSPNILDELELEMKQTMTKAMDNQKEPSSSSPAQWGEASP